MFRLRTTAALSLLALAVGIAGTHWLSQRSTDEPLALPPKRGSVAHPLAAAQPSHSRLRKAAWMPRHTSPQSVAGPVAKPDTAVPTTAAMLAPELVPLEMPAPQNTPYEQLRGHLDGRVIVHVDVDGSGHVIGASLAQSSGDEVLDTHALASVRGWRFAVPPDHPDGLSGDVPMRFSSHADPVASAP